MTRQERETLRNDIAMKNVMTKKIGSWSKVSLLIFLFFGAVAFWGFSGMNDNFLRVADSMRNILKWIALVIAIPAGIFSALSFLSFRNSKKHIFELIAKLEKK